MKVNSNSSNAMVASMSTDVYQVNLNKKSIFPKISL